MAVKFLCDGCDCELPAHVHTADCGDRCRGCKTGHDGVVVGRLDPAHYCPRCAAAWREADEAVRAKRAALIRDLEAFIRERDGALTATLKRLPA